VSAAPSAGAPSRHPLVEDLLALVTAAGFASLGFALLRQAGLVSGGAAGVALLLARVTPLSFGQLLVLVNLPFVALGLGRLGGRFTVKTLATVALVSAATDGLHLVLVVERLHPLYAALMGGSLVGISLLMLFRHQASLGGIGILAQWLQVRHGVRAGVFQLVADASIVGASVLLGVPASTLALSIAGAVALNLVLAVNHRPGRYLGA
jgi:uncharacterized membrane-anchored protein YitT (DUF2179 family)